VEKGSLDSNGFNCPRSEVLSHTPYEITDWNRHNPVPLVASEPVLV